MVCEGMLLQPAEVPRYFRMFRIFSSPIFGDPTRCTTADLVQI